jgi:SAM-dependent methyltransferase
MSDLTGGYAWPAGDRMARDLHAVAAFAGRRVLDLGCGPGQLGRRALALGAATVVFADGSAAVVAALAGFAAVEHRWGDPVPGAPFDVILGGDILYRPECFADLLRSIALALAPDGVALLSDPRPVLDAELPALAAAAHLTWTTARRADYTLATLTHGP